MPLETRYAPGDWNIICDRTGYKIKASQSRKEWTGNVVRTGSWERRHPIDFIRSIPDHQAVPDPNPEPVDRFLGDNEVKAEDL